MATTPSKPIISHDIYGKVYEVTIDQLSWRPSAYGIVIHDGNILLVKEREGYHLPGGGVDIHEDPADAAIREVMEETGLTVTNPSYAGILSTFFTWTDMDDHSLHHVHSLLLYYTCDLVGGELSKDGHDAYEQKMNLKPVWLPLNQLDDITINATIDWRPIIPMALARN